MSFEPGARTDSAEAARRPARRRRRAAGLFDRAPVGQPVEGAGRGHDLDAAPGWPGARRGRRCAHVARRVDVGDVLPGDGDAGGLGLQSVAGDGGERELMVASTAE